MVGGAETKDRSEPESEQPRPTGPSDRPQVRADLALLSGYHSPQLDVAVRLNTNEAPEPPPTELLTRVAAALSEVEWNRYPDRDAAALRERIARLDGFEPAQVFAANGSNEVLQCLLLAYGGDGRSALTFEPTYALHSHIARVCGTAVVEVERRDDFTIDLDDAVARIASVRPSVVFLCSPNNPTGLTETNDTVSTVLEATRAVGGLLVVDEAYGQFAPSSSLALVDEDTPLVVTRTYSKTWSMAALRLGYAVGPSWLVAELEKVVLPYHLDAVTQLIGTLALDYGDEMRARVASLVEERGRVEAALSALDVEQWPSGANFILFRPNAIDGDEVWQRLVDRSVLVRNCSSWPRLDGCLRVTLGTPTENDRFVAALTEILENR
jgi:histidinol-phosphate aminotransferase